MGINTGSSTPSSARYFDDEPVGPWWEPFRAPSVIEKRLGVSLSGFGHHGPDGLDITPRPVPAVTMVLTFSTDPLTVDLADKQLRMRAVAAGPISAITRARGHDMECIEVRMSPLTAHLLLGRVWDPGQPHLVDLEELWGSEATSLCERLAALTSWAERFELVESVLVSRFAAGWQPAPEVRAAWASILASHGSIRIERLAAQCNWSRKRLWSRFSAETGLAPKRAAKLVRFDAAARRLIAGDEPAQVAGRYGFSDQAHLHRDIRELLGITPGQLVSQSVNAA